MTTHVLVPRRSARAVRPVRTHWLGDFDRMFDDLWRGFGDRAMPVATPAILAPRIDYGETESEIRVAAELPGLAENDIEVSLEEGVLTIRGERAEDATDDGATDFRHVETFRGNFQRSIRLSSDVDEEAVAASYKNGVLTVTLPKVAEPEPEVRTIPVTIG